MSGPILRGGVYQMHVSVPADVAQRHKGKRVTLHVAGSSRDVTIGQQVKLSLKTSDKAAARERHRDAVTQLEEAYAALRQMDAQGPVRLTELQCHEIAGEYFRQTKERHEADPGTPEDWDGGLDAAHGLGETAKGREAMHGKAASAILQTRRMTVTTESRERLLVAMHAAFLDAAERIASWSVGNHRPMKGGEERYPTAAPIKPAPKITLAQVREAWIQDREGQGISPKTIATFQHNFASLVSHLGGDEKMDATFVTGDHIEDWLKALEARGLSRKTIAGGYRALVGAAFIQSKRRLGVNPFEGIRFIVPKQTRSRPKGFEDGEAKAILGAAEGLLGIGQGIGPSMRRAVRWVPWICAYTGARVGEILQLRTQDFRENHGIKLIEITPDGGTVKTDAFRRVPLHDHLLEQGLWDVVAALPPGPVFLNVKPDGTAIGKKGTMNQLREWVRDGVKITDPRVAPNHGWRHRFISLAREYQIPDETRDFITGHEDGRASRGYGEASLNDLHRNVNKIPRVITKPTTPPRDSQEAP